MRDAVSFLDQIIKDPVVLYGWSMGGIIGTMLASKYPELIKALILGDCPVFLFEQKEKWIANLEPYKNFLKKLIEFRSKFDSFNEFLLQSAQFMVKLPSQKELLSLASIMRGNIKNDFIFNLLAKGYYNLHEDVINGWFNPDKFEVFTEGYNTADLLPKINCPTMIIQADPNSGGMVTDDENRHMMNLIPNTTHSKLEKIDHALHLTNNVAFYTVLNEFLRKLE